MLKYPVPVSLNFQPPSNKNHPTLLETYQSLNKNSQNVCLYQTINYNFSVPGQGVVLLEYQVPRTKYQDKANLLSVCKYHVDKDSVLWAQIFSVFFQQHLKIPPKSYSSVASARTFKCHMNEEIQNYMREHT